MSAIEIVLDAKFLIREEIRPSRSTSTWNQVPRTGRVAVRASTGSREAVELRDGGDAWGGKGVQHAVDFVNGEIRDCWRALTPKTSAPWTSP